MTPKKTTKTTSYRFESVEEVYEEGTTDFEPPMVSNYLGMEV